MAEKVVNAKSPKDAKIASEVKIPGSWWDNAKYDIMREVFIAKIGSIKFFMDVLLNSGDKNLVEALVDAWWGCGLTISQLKPLPSTILVVISLDNC